MEDQLLISVLKLQSMHMHWWYFDTQSGPGPPAVRRRIPVFIKM